MSGSFRCPQALELPHGFLGNLAGRGLIEEGQNVRAKFGIHVAELALLQFVQQMLVGLVRPVIFGGLGWFACVQVVVRQVQFK